MEEIKCFSCVVKNGKAKRDVVEDIQLEKEIEVEKMVKGEENRELLERVLRAKDPGLEVTLLESTPACGVGDNFMSAVSRLVVTLKPVKMYSTKKSFLVKRQLESQLRRDVLRCDPAFRNEAAAYEVVLPVLSESVRLPFPDCLHASDDCLILEDLRQAGFKMPDRRKGLDFRQASLALEALGRFHGRSMLLKALKPARLLRLRSAIQEYIFVPDAALSYDNVLQNSLDLALRTLQEVPLENGLRAAFQRLEATRESLFQRLFLMITPREPLAVICHGDFYINNMMFRYNEDGSAEEVCFVDLQACRYSSPAIDLLYFIGTSLQPGLLLAEHRALLQTYHSALVAQLPPQGAEVKLEDIEKELKERAVFGLVMALVVLPAVTALPGAFDVERESYPTVEECLSTLSPEYSVRLQDLLRTFHALGYF